MLSFTKKGFDPSLFEFPKPFLGYGYARIFSGMTNFNMRTAYFNTRFQQDHIDKKISGVNKI